jgi:hypothetical protein
MPVSCFVFWRRFREDHLWRKFAGWTRGVIIVAAIVLMKLCQLEPNPVSPWSGCFSECYSSPILDGYLRLRWCFTDEVKSRKLISNLTNYKSHDYSLLIALVVFGPPALYFAWRSKEFRKFLAGAFFVSGGIQFYLYLTNVSVPLWAQAMSRHQSLVACVQSCTSYSSY